MGPTFISVCFHMCTALALNSNSVTEFFNITLTLTDSTIEQFNIARKYAELVNSTKSQISIKEVGTL